MEQQYIPTENEISGTLAPIDLMARDAEELLLEWYETNEALACRGQTSPGMPLNTSKDKGTDTRIRDWVQPLIVRFQAKNGLNKLNLFKLVAYEVSGDTSPWHWTDDIKERLYIERYTNMFKLNDGFIRGRLFNLLCEFIDKEKEKKQTL